MIDLAWLVPVMPLAAYVLHVFAGKPLGERASWFGVAALGLATLFSLTILAETLGGATAAVSVPWLSAGGVEVDMGFQVGPLEAAMLCMVSLVSWMVVIYSRGYMHGDSRYNRFFAVVNLFVFGMLSLVIADNFLLFIFAWEIMGLCSFLLIGHWFEDLNNARASLKAFLTTRIGDVGFMVGIWLLYAETGSLRFDVMSDAVAAGRISVPALTLIALMLFTGAVGKSAQVPLQVWLPDAMAGPTPVSALIHAATMVAAGVFLVARAYPVFAAAPAALLTVAWIGGITAFMAATIAVVQTDIKKVLAYSTISQLGYMMLAMGVGGFAAAIFHLIAHAFFKALLFLGSGSVIHAAGTQEMPQMGGLFRKLPWTGITFIIGSLALAGIWPFAGFFSKDEILLHAYSGGYASLYYLGIAAAFLTAYYMARTVWLTFFGAPRDKQVYDHAHESPPVMVGPLIVLAIPTVLFGWLGSPSFNLAFQRFVEGDAFHAVDPVASVMFTALGVAVGGIVVGYAAYALIHAGVRHALADGLGPVYSALKEKWFFDHAAAGVVALTRWAGIAVDLADRYVVDGIVNGVAAAMMKFGQGTRSLATGNAQAYMLSIFAAVVVGIFILQVIGGPAR